MENNFMETLGLQTSTGRMMKNRSQRSLPNMMELEVEVNQSQMKAQQRRSFSNFMDRMNNCGNDYFQQVPADASRAPPPPPTKPVRSHSTGDLLDLDKNTNSEDSKSPANFFRDTILKGLLRQGDVTTFSDSFWEAYFLPITPERIQGFTHESVGAIRACDVVALRKVIRESGASSMNACTRQGESLLHVACRRGDEAVFRFLVQEAGVSVKVRDDWNKTTLHDLCWNSKVGNTAQFRQVELLLDQAPELLFTKDKRGFTPLQYVPKDSWAEWCQFLVHQKDTIRANVQAMEFDS